MKIVERTTVHISDDTGRIAMLEIRTQGNASDDNNTDEVLTRYIYSNHLQSASLELDANAQIISYEEYYPYGSTSFQSGRSLAEVSLKRYRYTGKERDEESGLYYHGARYYIPWLCRWSAVDPLESKYAGMNPYNYGNCNPITYNDPSGMSGEKGGLWFGYYDSDGAMGYKWASGANSLEDIQRNNKYDRYQLTGDVYQTLDYNDKEGKHTYLWADGSYSQSERSVGQEIKGWFGLDSNGYLERNKYSSGEFGDANNYIVFAGNASGSVYNFGVDVFYSFKNFSLSGLKDEAVGTYNYYNQSSFSKVVGDTKNQFAATFSDIRFYENIGGGLMTANVSSVSRGIVSATTIETKTFYTIQGAEDAARLRSTGSPWPTAANRSALGEGVYAWDNAQAASKYLKIWESQGVKDLEIVEFNVKVKNLNKFNSLNIDNLANPEAWLEQNSKLWNGTPT